MGEPGQFVKTCSSNKDVHIFVCTVHFSSTLTIVTGNIWGTYEMNGISQTLCMR